MQLDKTLQTKSIEFPSFATSETPKTLASVKNAFVGKIEDLSFCTWISFSFFKKDTFVLYDGGNGTKNEGFGIQLYTEIGFLALGDIWYMYELPPNSKQPESWQQYCFTLEFASKIVKFYVDDHLVFEKIDELNLKDFKFSENLVQNSIFGKKYYENDASFNGQFTGVNIWSSVLTKTMIKVSNL